MKQKEQDKTETKGTSSATSFSTIEFRTVIRGAFERSLVWLLCANLRRLIRCLTREHDKHPSLLINVQIKKLQAHHDELVELMAVYDGKQSANEIKEEVSSEQFMEFPSQLIRLRMRHDISIKQLAERSGISRRSLTRYERSNYESATFKTMVVIWSLLRKWQ